MYEQNQIADFLVKVPLFRGLKKRQLNRLATLFVPRNYAAGKSIVEQDKGGEGFFIIVSGKAEAIREQNDGRKVVLNSLGPTDFFGELALLDDGLRSASVVSTEDTECLVLTRWDFLTSLQEDAEMTVVILQELARRFRLALDVL